MNNSSVLDYTGCCSKLEKIASKRKMYGSESNIRLNNKDSKPAISTENVLLNEMKSKSKMIPFICVGSANKSHHMGINLQTTLSMIKRFPGSNFDGQECAANGSGHVSARLHKTNDNGAGASQQSLNVHACPARLENPTDGDENETFEGTERDPWAVSQIDVANFSQGDRRKTACSCWSRATENYYKVMTPFVADVRRKHNNGPSGTVQNPYVKEKLVKYYELLSKHLLSLKSTIVAMNNEFLQLAEKYNRLYRQHVRNQNGSLTATLLQTEDELNALKSKVEETVDVYKEAVFAVQQRAAADSDARLQANAAGADADVRPRETTGVRLSKVLRRVQCLQEKLKSAHIVHGPSGDQTAVVVVTAAAADDDDGGGGNLY